MIDERAVIHPTATLAPDVSVGPWSQIGADVEIGEGSIIDAHVVITGPAKIGKHNRISSFSSIGGDPQDLKFKPKDRTSIEIGDYNVIREFCSLSRGTVHGGSVTRIGNYNFLMAYAHVAHDCQVGNHTVLSNTVNIAGHVTIDDFAVLGGGAAVLQKCRIGAYSFVCGFSAVVKDIPPFILVDGRPIKPMKLNTVGLKRHEFSELDLKMLDKAYRIFYRQGLLFEEAKTALVPLALDNKAVARFLDFLNQPSNHGVIR